MEKTKAYGLQVKSTDGTTGIVEGYASVTGVLDLDNEICDRNCFRQTIEKTQGKWPVLWGHDRKTPVGWNLSASEDDYGLKVRFKLMVDTEIGRMALSFCKGAIAAGASAGLSIGFMVPAGGSYVSNGVTHFKTIDLKEFSIVTFAAQPLATVLSAKSADMERQAFAQLTKSLATLATSVKSGTRELEAAVRQRRLRAEAEAAGRQVSDSFARLQQTLQQVIRREAGAR